MAPVALIMSTGEMSQLLQNKGGRPPIALQEQSSPEGYASEVDSEVDEDEDSLQVLAALVPVPSKSSISSPSAVSGLLISPKSRSRDSDEDSADEGYYGVDDDNSDEKLIDNIFSALLLARNDKKILDRHTYEPSRQDKELSNTTREAIFSNMILTTAEHNELRLRPLVLNCRKCCNRSLSARIVDDTSLVARISTTAQKDYSKSNKDASAPASSDSNSNVAAIGVDESALMTYTFPYSRTMPRFPWIIDSGAKVHCVGVVNQSIDSLVADYRSTLVIAHATASVAPVEPEPPPGLLRL
ncbi:BQ5605_C007g04690 [Microbotryum silenes-dioicae]|uniref:BQ5605_C007g04690 protein n=1 Tax=Microbotryum silenes-dioicae TaxID=796604 RepID=A0A2X0M7S0_9BASI|nr:BQ5605_C007g04690 [Microbotryum silenes-dioicae]